MPCHWGARQEGMLKDAVLAVIVHSLRWRQWLDQSLPQLWMGGGVCVLFHRWENQFKWLHGTHTRTHIYTHTLTFSRLPVVPFFHSQLHCNSENVGASHFPAGRRLEAQPPIRLFVPWLLFAELSRGEKSSLNRCFLEEESRRAYPRSEGSYVGGRKEILVLFLWKSQVDSVGPDVELMFVSAAVCKNRAVTDPNPCWWTVHDWQSEWWGERVLRGQNLPCFNSTQL